MVKCLNCNKSHSNKTYCSNKCKLKSLHRHNVGNTCNVGNANGMYKKKPWNYQKYSVKPKKYMVCVSCKTKYTIKQKEARDLFIEWIHQPKSYWKLHKKGGD